MIRVPLLHLILASASFVDGVDSSTCGLELSWLDSELSWLEWVDKN
jgi:hypothetical protein